MSCLASAGMGQLKARRSFLCSALLTFMCEGGTPVILYSVSLKEERGELGGGRGTRILVTANRFGQSFVSNGVVRTVHSGARFT